MHPLQPGKLPAEMLAHLLERYGMADERLIVGPGIGEDAAAIDMGNCVLVAKTDPITFATDRIGWYAVNVNANDVATMGARPRWFLATVLMPEKKAGLEMADSIFNDITSACRSLGAVCCGGHIEITAGLERVLVCGQMLGEVAHDRLLNKSDIRPGMTILLAKPIGIEATSIIARERTAEVTERFGSDFTERARDFLFDPGISVVAPALAAASVEGVAAMHDPTEGGVATGLHELAEAGGVGIMVNTSAILIHDETARLCEMFGVNPLGVISSGALLIAAADDAADGVRRAVEAHGADCAAIARTTERAGEVIDQHGVKLPRFDSDEISKAL